MTIPADQISTATAPTLVQDDIPCRKCQYNLRTLSTDTRCPECGTPVGFSIKGDLIRYSDPDWVDTVGRGLRCIVGILVLGDFGAIASLVCGAMRWDPPDWFGYGIVFGIVCLMMIGPWLLTTPDPSGLGEDRYGRSRKLIRVSLFSAIFGAIVLGMVARLFLPRDLSMRLRMLGTLALLLGMAGNCAMANYLSKLAMRLPDPGLAARARFVMWGLGICIGVPLLFFFISIIDSMTGGSLRANLMGGESCFMGLDILALILFSILYLNLLDNMRIKFKQQSTLARQTWAAASHTTNI